MSEVIKAESKRFMELLDKFGDVRHRYDVSNLQFYFLMGELTVEFMDAEDNKYGDHTVEGLAQALKETGALGDMKDAERFLYNAAALFRAYPNFKALAKLAEQGFTVSHAKRLTGLDPELRKEVEQHLMENGQVISTRELDQKISELSKETAVAEVKALADAPDIEDEPKPAEKVATKAGPIAPSYDSSKEPEPKKGEKEKPAGPVRKAEVTEVVSPMKAIKGMEKSISRAVTEAADVIIAIRAVQKRGFDSDKAHANFKNAVANLSSALRAALETFPEVLEASQEYTNSEG
jgi:hypothetical protein